MTPNAPVIAPTRYRSKTLATWVAVIGGAFGLHRFYLHGLGDRWGWLFVPPTLVGLYGVRRMREFGVDDHLAWVLIPPLGFALAVAMISAIVYGLTPDERWNTRYNGPSGAQHRTGWMTVLGVIAALILGAGVLMATIAFSAQRYFEYQAEAANDAAQRSTTSPSQ
ncbi:MAG TPA: hypothetical protein VJO99_21820 [Burkholderiaceae bacterium]|nr:hypothetical protein [Burkholderiaceae bacterium]